MKQNCKKCGINYDSEGHNLSEWLSTKNLQFHHTNYENNEGFTLCAGCHSKITRGELI